MFYRPGEAPDFGSTTPPFSGHPAPQGDGMLDERDVDLVQHEDGSIELVLREPEISDLRQLPWDANIAEHLDESQLSALASEILQGIEADEDSRKQWLEAYKKGVTELGITDPFMRTDWPFEKACGATYPLLLEAVIRFQATARGEMLPAQGPVKTTIVGDVTPDAEAQAERVQHWLNFYLTEIDEGYYPDFDQMLFYLALCGTTFRKVYRDPVKNRPMSRMVTPDNMIVNYAATNINSTGRITEVEMVAPADLIRRQLSGYYRNIELQEPQEDENVATRVKDKVQGRTPTRLPGDDRHTLYHCHCDIEVEGMEHLGADGAPSGLPCPFVVTVERDSRRILAVRRNWKQGDPMCERQDVFVQYDFIPGLGLYSLGYTHLLGGLSTLATGIMRRFADNLTLASFPGGVRAKGATRLEENKVPIGPCEWREIDTGGLPLNQVFMPLPYRDPSPVAGPFLDQITTAGERIGSTAEMNVGEGRQDAPVGSTIALIEQATKMMSAVLKRAHTSHRKELRLLSEQFATDQDAKYPYEQNGKRGTAVAADFSGPVRVVPVSDPNMPTQTQRVAMAQAQLQVAQQAPPGMMDLRFAYQQLARTIGMPDNQVQALMPPPQDAQPADVITENQGALQRKPLKAAPWQNHAAHIKAHMEFLQVPGVQKSPAASALLDHISEHLGLEYRNQVQTAIGGPTPQPPAVPGQPPQQLPPQVQNAIDAKVAAVAQQITQQLQQTAMMMGMQGADPNAMMEAQLKMHELDVKREDMQRKSQEADVQNKTEGLKAQVSAANDTAERASRERIAAIQLQIAQLGLEQARITADSADKRADASADVARQKVTSDQARGDAEVNVAKHQAEADKHVASKDHAATQVQAAADVQVAQAQAEAAKHKAEEAKHKPKPAASKGKK